MTAYDLYMGGISGNTSNRLVPSAGAALITGFADHQRARDYAVTRQVDFRPRVPYGGIDGTVDQKDYDWYKALLESGKDVIVGDIINLIAIPPNTRLHHFSAQVVIPRTGLAFTVGRVVLVGGVPTPVAPPAQVNDPGYVPAVAMGAVKGLYTSAQLLDTGGAPDSMSTLSYLSIAITAVPAAPAKALEGLFLMVQAEVEDWGSYDFNGNA